MSERYNTIVRVVAAAFVLGGGFVHYQLWSDKGYRHIDTIGPMFAVNVISSVAIAGAIVAWKHWAPIVCGLGLVNGTLLAFALSRTGDGIFDFTEVGWNPSPWAAWALIFEIGAAAALVLLLAWTPLPLPFHRDESTV